MDTTSPWWPLLFRAGHVSIALDYVTIETTDKKNDNSQMSPFRNLSRNLTFNRTVPKPDQMSARYRKMNVSKKKIHKLFNCQAILSIFRFCFVSGASLFWNPVDWYVSECLIKYKRISITWWVFKQSLQSFSSSLLQRKGQSSSKGLLASATPPAVLGSAGHWGLHNHIEGNMPSAQNDGFKINPHRHLMELNNNQAAL